LRNVCNLSQPICQRRFLPVHVLKHVLHGYADDAAVQILCNCRASLPDDGHILIVEFVLPDVIDRADADLEKRLLSDLNMLAKARSVMSNVNCSQHGLAGMAFVCVHAAVAIEQVRPSVSTSTSLKLRRWPGAMPANRCGCKQPRAIQT
jgi:hypothetical protein